MDALSTILETTRLSGMIYEKFIVSGSWGVDIAEDKNSQFWRLIKGKCLIGFPDNTFIEMNEGDLVYISHGGGHWIADSPSSTRIPSQKYVKARHLYETMCLNQSNNKQPIPEVFLIQNGMFSI
jgi:hypothetical protein